MQAVGIGDLHLDSPLSQYIPNHNKVVLDEVRLVVEWAIVRHIFIVILYGDIGHRDRLSDEAHKLLLSLYYEYPQVRFIVIKGNHDTKSNEENGLNVLAHLSSIGGLPNVKLILDKPTLLFKNTDAPVYALPWPYSKTRADALNVLHTEVHGAVWDTGRGVVVDNQVNTKHLSVIGHIHTSQRIGNAHFSGTLYQTTFGETPQKFFHHIHWTGDIATSKIRKIPHVPKYTLLNAIINDKREVKDLPTDPLTLVKVFVNKDVILPDNVFDRRPNVVKFNNFSSRTELKVLMQEELELDDLSSEVRIDLDAMLNTWMSYNKVEDHIVERVPGVIDRLLAKR